MASRGALILPCQISGIVSTTLLFPGPTQQPVKGTSQVQGISGRWEARLKTEMKGHPLQAVPGEPSAAQVQLCKSLKSCIELSFICIASVRQLFCVWVFFFLSVNV